jgi:hypothetical protein
MGPFQGTDETASFRRSIQVVLVVNDDKEEAEEDLAVDVMRRRDSTKKKKNAKHIKADKVGCESDKVTLKPSTGTGSTTSSTTADTDTEESLSSSDHSSNLYVEEDGHDDDDTSPCRIRQGGSAAATVPNKEKKSKEKKKRVRFSDRLIEHPHPIHWLVPSPLSPDEIRALWIAKADLVRSKRRVLRQCARYLYQIDNSDNENNENGRRKNSNSIRKGKEGDTTTTTLTIRDAAEHVRSVLNLKTPRYRPYTVIDLDDDGDGADGMRMRRRKFRKEREEWEQRTRDAAHLFASDPTVRGLEKMVRGVIDARRSCHCTPIQRHRQAVLERQENRRRRLRANSSVNSTSHMDAELSDEDDEAMALAAAIQHYQTISAPCVAWARMLGKADERSSFASDRCSI